MPNFAGSAPQQAFSSRPCSPWTIRALDITCRSMLSAATWQRSHFFGRVWRFVLGGLLGSPCVFHPTPTGSARAPLLGCALQPPCLGGSRSLQSPQVSAIPGRPSDGMGVVADRTPLTRRMINHSPPRRERAGDVTSSTRGLCSLGRQHATASSQMVDPPPKNWGILICCGKYVYVL